MIHDCLDGTSGRRVWQLARRGYDDLYVIAATEAKALAWLASLAGETQGVPVTVTDRGSADRTEVGLWHDETRL